jgi:hypothetical protein
MQRTCIGTAVENASLCDVAQGEPFLYGVAQGERFLYKVTQGEPFLHGECQGRYKEHVERRQ